MRNQALATQAARKKAHTITNIINNITIVMVSQKLDNRERTVTLMSAINCATTAEPYCGQATDSAAMHFAMELYAC